MTANPDKYPQGYFNDKPCKECGGKGFLMRDTHKSYLVIDHCHSSGVIRGLLCHNCNRALGLLQDDVSYLEKAISYLKRAETIPYGSTSQAIGDGSAQPLEKSDDIVRSI
jgi:hypothetical protein